ncbi:MAG: heme-binding protein, partial [Pseudomonadota bacterium]|nr:heme-binding protein [Pseudomonadota bacterium]
MRKFAFVLSGFAALAITLFVSSTSAIEEPSYSLVAAWDDPDVEIRDYDARILATTQMNEGQNSGFRVL